MSVVEVLVASTLSLMILTSVGYAFIAHQKQARQSTQSLMLIKSLAGALDFLRDEARRAGYNRLEGRSLVVEGKGSVITTIENSITFSYHSGSESDPHLKRLVSVFSDMESRQLKVCAKNITHPGKIYEGECLRHYSMLDEQHIELESFSVTQTFSGDTNSISLVTIALSLRLREHPEKQQSGKITFVVRNG